MISATGIGFCLADLGSENGSAQDQDAGAGCAQTGSGIFPICLN